MFDLIDYIFMFVAFVLVTFCVISFVRFYDFVDVTKGSIIEEYKINMKDL